MRVLEVRPGQLVHALGFRVSVRSELTFLEMDGEAELCWSA